MKILAINGSARNNGNSAQLLHAAMEGAVAALPEGTAETHFVGLYSLNFTGCRSCFACKRIGAKTYGTCAVRDGLTPLLQEASEADVVLLGSPIYFGYISGMMHCFLERFIFPYYVYDDARSSIAPKHMQVGCIYSMNLTETAMEKLEYRKRIWLIENFMSRIIAPPESLYVNDTFQFPDYSKYVSPTFDPEKKRRRREEHFPIDLDNARSLGRKLALRAAGLE